MADGNQSHDWQATERDSLDRELEAALAKYTTVEPRAGLEERVLANLRTEPSRVPLRPWWQWGAVAALTAIVVVAVALAWWRGRPSPAVVTNHPSATKQAPKQPAMQAASNGEGNRVRPPEPRVIRKVTADQAHPQVAIALPPKLDQFPSPEPLSEQEKILQEYVAEYPDHAVLIARARSEALRRDAEEIRKASEIDDGR